MLYKKIDAEKTLTYQQIPSMYDVSKKKKIYITYLKRKEENSLFFDHSHCGYAFIRTHTGFILSQREKTLFTAS